MKATNLEARRKSDGSVDLRFSTDLEVQEISLVPEAAHLLMAVALMTVPGDMIPEHDGFRLAKMPDGAPVLQFRFSADNWLSIVLGPLDLETLESALPRR